MTNNHLKLKRRDGSYTNNNEDGTVLRDSNVHPLPVVVRQGDWAAVKFFLKNRSSYLRVALRTILREGHVLGYGVVKALL